MPINWSQPVAVEDACRRRMTLLWARRFCIVTAWAYVFNVTRLEAGRSNSCVTLMSVLFALNNEEYVCRKVCHPMCCVIPAIAAAGRIIVRIRDCPQYGLRPRVAGLANTQSSAWLYFVRSRQILRDSASRESSGTGFCDASVLQGPTTWNTMERVTLIWFL